MTGTQRIRQAFTTAHGQGRSALVTYLMGGAPTPAHTQSHLHALAEGGSDLIEIGIPFSDPVADGPTIQAAAVTALKAGTRPRHVLDAVRAFRDAGETTPVVTMTYANIPFSMGYERYAAQLADAGIDGTIIPDIPVDEAGPLSDAMASAGLANVLLAAPMTRSARLDRVARATRGFLYLVGSFGTTGARAELADETLDVLDQAIPAARGADVPLAVGFGISNPDQVRALVAHGADGVVVGSHLVQLVADGADPTAIRDAVKVLATGLAHPN